MGFWSLGQFEKFRKAEESTIKQHIDDDEMFFWLNICKKGYIFIFVSRVCFSEKRKEELF